MSFWLPRERRFLFVTDVLDCEAEYYGDGVRFVWCVYPKSFFSREKDRDVARTIRDKQRVCQQIERYISKDE